MKTLDVVALVALMAALFFAGFSLGSAITGLIYTAHERSAKQPRKKRNDRTCSGGES